MGFLDFSNCMGESKLDASGDRWNKSNFVSGGNRAYFNLDYSDQFDFYNGTKKRSCIKGESIGI